MKSWMILLLLGLGNIPLSWCQEQEPAPRASSKEIHSGYSFEDLKVLAQNGPYPEFFDHIYDIRPVGRDQAWLNLARETSEKYVLHLYHKKIINLQSWQKLRKVAAEYYNKDNSGLAMAMSKYGLALVEGCFQTDGLEECFRQAREVFGEQTDPQLAHDLGKVIHDYYLKRPELELQMMDKVWPFYSVMAKHTLSEFYCGKPYFEEVVLRKIHQQLEGVSEEKLAAQLFEIVHPDCWAKISSSLQKDLNAKPGQELNFKLLLATKSIGRGHKFTYHMLYMLQNPKPGQLLKNSFDSLLELKDSYSDRKMVMQKLTELDPLPGHIFTQAQSKEAMVIIKNLTKYFPEYIDHYAQTCLSYLDGAKQFPSGNPTPECSDLFELSKNQQIVPAPVVERYQRLRNFQ